MSTALPLVSGDETRDFGGLPAQLRSAAVSRIDRLTSRFEANVPWLEAGLRRFEPTLSLRSIRARVVAIRSETHDVKTYVLRPNARFRRYKPGSFVNVKVRIDGKSHQRSYSISSAPSRDGTFAITVKRVQGGLVSNWLADKLKVGDILALSAPTGQFVLPDEPPAALLMISAGSGVTPVMSMLRHLIASGTQSEITFVHFARSPRDIIFHDELRELAEKAPNLRLAFCVEQADDGWTGGTGRFTQALLEEIAPRYRELDVFLCGPSAFMKAVVKTLEQTEADLSRLRYERFNVDFDATQFLDQAQLVRFVRSGSESIANKPRTILDEAERLGVKLEWGCRAGNCGTCRCKKKSGVVTDITTGAESGAGEEFIYACVSVPRGVVEVDL